MADTAQSTGTHSGLVIPKDTQQKFASLIVLITASESMTDEERQYWINILPVMTPDQLASLTDILETEKRQLAAIDSKYAKEIEVIGKQKMAKKIEDERRHQREGRRSQEAKIAQQDAARADELLGQIEA